MSTKRFGRFLHLKLLIIPKPAEEAGRTVNMWKGLLKTSGSIVDMLLRLTPAAVFFSNRAQKVLGWFCGYGLAGMR